MTKETRASVLALFAALLVAGLGCSPAFASDQPVAHLTDFTGIVVIQSQGNWGVKPEKGFPLYSNDKVVTRIGTALVTFKDGATVEIKTNSNLLIEEQEQAGSVTRNLRLLLGKLLFKTGVGSKTQTKLQTPTAVCGLRGTAGVLSIGVDGQAYIQFTQGGSSYTVGEFISGVAKDVPQELADMNPAQRAAFVAAAAADQAQKAAEAAKDGKISDPQAALAAGQAAEAAAREAKAAADSMANNPDPTIKAQAQAASAAASAAIEAAKDAQNKAIEQGAKPGEPGTYTPPAGGEEGKIGFDVTPPETVTSVLDVTTTIALSTTTVTTPTTSVPPPPPPPPPPPATTGMVSMTVPGFLDSGLLAGNIDDATNVGAFALSGQYQPDEGGTIQSPAVGNAGGLMSDGSAFDGYVAGLEGSWRGLFSSIYVKPDGGAGFLTGSLSGGALNGTLLATGPVTRGPVLGTAANILPGYMVPGGLQDALNNWQHPAYQDFSGLVVPVFDNVSIWGGQAFFNSGLDYPNYIQGISLTNPPGRVLGVWSSDHPWSYYYNGSSTPLWTGKYGYGGYGYFGYSDHYMLGDLTITDDLNDHVKIFGEVEYLDYDYFGKISFSHGYGGMQDVSTGTVVLDPLAWSGNWGDGGSIYRNDLGNFQYVTSDPGIIGGLQAPWDYPVTSFIAMGEAGANFGQEGYLWNSDIYATGQGGGEIRGYTAGIWQNGIMDGASVALYISPDGRAGIVSGTVSGNYYDTWHSYNGNLWKASGTWSRLREEAGLAGYGIDWGNLSNTRLAGQFSGVPGSSISGNLFYGYSKFLANYVDSPYWGIYDLKLGSFMGNTFSGKPGTGGDWSGKIGGGGKFGYMDEGYWLANVGGSWSAEGLIRGSLSGTYLTPKQIGTIGGTFFGVNDLTGDGSGYWIGQSIGTFEGQPLAFSGSLSNGWYHFLMTGLVMNSGSLSGLIGGVDPLVQVTPSSFAAMGTFENPEGYNLFSARVDGTGSAFRGFVIGRTSGEAIESSIFRGISVEGTDIFHLGGTLTGSAYPAIGIWEGSGTVQALTTLPVSQASGKIGGGIGSGALGDSTMTIDQSFRNTISPADNPDWGLFIRSYEGTYTAVPTASWNAKYGLVTSEPGYILGDISGDAWGASTFDAYLTNLMYMTPQYKVSASGSMANLLGAYSDGTWKGVTSGSFVRTPLTFSSVLDYYALRMVEGQFTESSFRREAVPGQWDRYEYEYFVADSGPLILGHKESYPYNAQSQEEIYFQNGYYFTASEWPPWRATTHYTPWTVGSLTPDYFTALPSGGAWTREWYEQYDAYLLWRAGSISAILGGTGDLWAASQAVPASMTVLGKYVPDDGNYTIPSVFRFNADSSTFTIGAYRGDVIGRIDDQEAKGLLYAVYVDPNQNAGILKGSFDGTVYKQIGMWEAAGSLYPIQMASNIGFAPSALGENMISGVLGAELAGYFGTVFSPIPNSRIEGSGAGLTRSIKGQDWGVYRYSLGMDNWIEGLSSAWAARAGGVGEFGTHPRLGQTDPMYDVGLWLTDSISGWTMGNRIDAMGYTGKYLTYRQYGTLTGDIIGTTDAANSTWQGFSAGTWEKTGDLAFSAIVRGGGQVRTQVKAYDGNYADGGSYYNYTYYDGFDRGRSQEYDAATNTTTHAEYYGDMRKAQWADANGVLSYTESPWSGSLSTALAYGSTLFDSAEPIAPAGPDYRLESAGYINGIIGGLGDPWTATQAAPAQIVILGEYDSDQAVPGIYSVFGFEFFSYNPYHSNITQQSRTVWNQAQNSEYGAFRGFAGGTLISNQANPNRQDDIGGSILGLYVDPSGNAGVLKGGFTGTGYSDLEMWEATGSLYPVELVTGTGIAPADFYGSVMQSSSNYVPAPSEIAGAFFDAGNPVGAIEVHSRERKGLTIAGQDWGISQVMHGGTYSGLPEFGASWMLLSDFVEDINPTTAPLGIRKMATIEGSIWSTIDKKIQGTGSGAWVNWDQAVTGVMGGKLAGTFNPNNATWQAVSQWTHMGTERFLTMAATVEGRAALEKLNIPCIQLGIANLAGSSAIMNVNMNDVKFFAYSTGADPRVWATNNITGSYSASPSVGHNVPLTSTSGGILTGSFTVQNWGNNKWGANVAGTGSLNRTDVGGTVNIDFKGGAAGSYTGSTSGNFTGTGSGVAQKTGGDLN
ncbi:MAG: FecR domain-containing protein [Thermodesulfobacteriota bacterium]